MSGRGVGELKVEMRKFLFIWHRSDRDGEIA